MKVDVLGYGVDALTRNACAAKIFCKLQGDNSVVEGCSWLACINPHSYAVALDDAPFSRALKAADWLVPDGVGVVLASRFLGGEIPERVTGSDVFYELHRRMSAVGGMSVFFLGATEETLAGIRERMARDYSGIRIAGTYSPPFKENYSAEENNTMIAAINLARPDVLWVGMTAPKQEKWIYENQARLNVKFAGAIGAVFDFYVGRVKRSHPAFRFIGLEWLPRLLQEPRRLWRRMFISAPVFMWHVLGQKFGRHL